MTTNPPHHNASEAEFLAALRQRWPRLLATPATSEEHIEWKQFASSHSPRGQKREKDISHTLALAEQFAGEGMDFKQAVSRAIRDTGLRYPPSYKSDQKAWQRRLVQSYRDAPKHHHELLDAERRYDAEHALYALICRWPEIAAAIFITSDSDMRKRIIRALF